jgi:hypothetical protein
MNKTTVSASLSDAFRVTLSAVDTASQGLGAAVADMLALGNAEYLTFDQFREAVKAGLSPRAWDTVTNYMGPMRRAWENGKVAEYVAVCRADGIKAANKLFPAGTGKRGNTSPSVAEDVTEAAQAEAAQAEAAPIATVLSRADELIEAAMKEAEQEAVKAELEAVKAELEAVKAELEAVKAELEAVKAEKVSKPRKLQAAA